ncbi:hypothetical protein B9Z55_027243 [Caenorhabditis nigoni]|uniref:Uncharacterized protein n=1 Tax=Caenorhabditis nigoni TaxID=1611254 RepID=A0A2G5SHF2_9PELO|nr:hypothetical protein B9Z55_027243 [Caenorhabditis nigoni]
MKTTPTKRSRQSQRKEGEKRGRPPGSTNRSRSSKSRKPATDLQEPQDQVHQDQEPQVQDPEADTSQPDVVVVDEPGKRSLRKRPEPTLVLKRTPTRSRSRKRKPQEPQKVQQPEDQLPVGSQMQDPAYQQQVFSPTHAPVYGNPGSDPSGYGNGNGYSYDPPQFSPGPNAVQDYLQASFNSPPPSHHYYHGPSGFPIPPYEQQQQHYGPQYADIYGQGTSSDSRWTRNPFQAPTSPMEHEPTGVSTQNLHGYLPGGSEAVQQAPNSILRQPTTGAEDHDEEGEDSGNEQVTASQARAQASETEGPGNPTSPAAANGTGNSTPRSVSTEKGGYGTPVNDEPMAVVPISPRNGSQLPTSTGQSPNAPQTAQEPVQTEQNYVPATLPASTIPFVGSMSYYGNGSSTAITTVTSMAQPSALEQIMANGRNLPGPSTQQPSQGGSPEY